MKISMRESGHTWRKLNSITQEDSDGNFYDSYACECGLSGKRYGFSSRIDVDGRKTKTLVCPNFVSLVQKVKVIHFTGLGANCLPNSVHDVVNPPDNDINNKNGIKGYWIMGATDIPVMLLHREVIEL